MDSEKSKKNWFARHKILTGILVIIIIGVVVGAGSSPESNTNNNDSTQEKESPTNTPSKENIDSKIYALNEDVSVENRVTWNITKVQDLGQKIASGNQFIDDLTTSEKFIRVEGTVKNISSEQISYLQPKIVDKQNRTFDANNNAWSVLTEVDRISSIDTFNPSISKKFVEIFEVPADAEELKLEVTNMGIFKVENKLVDLKL